MKTLYSLVFTIIFSVSGWAQITDYNKIVPGEDTRPKTFEDYLVQLAWNNSPNNKIMGSNQKIAELEVDLTKREWMKNLQVQWNLNEISLSNIIYDFDDPLFVALPIWNITATADLNTVFNRKKRIDVSKQKLEITRQNVNLLKLKTRALVLERYYEYLLSLDILKVRTEAEQDAKENQTLLKELFQDNKAKFEELSRAALAFTQAKEARISAEMEIQLSKIALEELIGMSYEEAEKYGRQYKKKEK